MSRISGLRNELFQHPAFNLYISLLFFCTRKKSLFSFNQKTSEHLIQQNISFLAYYQIWRDTLTIHLRCLLIGDYTASPFKILIKCSLLNVIYYHWHNRQTIISKTITFSEALPSCYFNRKSLKNKVRKIMQVRSLEFLHRHSNELSYQ